MISKRGRVIAHNVVLQPHEQDIVQFFVEQGIDIELIPTARSKRGHSADAIINGVVWEFKTLHGKSARSLERILKKAVTQSNNVIVDLRKVQHDENQMLCRAKYEAAKNKSIRRLRVILRDAKNKGKIIDIK